jgi:parvulin-like peptidyl-prolyl isomerase
LAKGEPFADLAREYSEDKRTAAAGGLIDLWVTAESHKFAPAFQKALFALQRQGEVSPPVRTRYGTHLIQWAATEPSRIPEFAEIRDQSIAQLRSEYLASKQAAARTAAYPDVHSLRLDEVRALLERAK